ncbi:predicted protein [Uncinocarpus reesii 1704]|uniref:Uncharacterized protein n=1 Tax=Uncinocarpus reesii (strain UAMH 1704) TaxID=336963 RepID=C4JDW2_UNCRE|nr:uncharacterized protein UREG_00589 [Uncinocarpus reesii 1704]EEP75742.1 predicted protein [Uncinocarpus reesii 1704]
MTYASALCIRVRISVSYENIAKDAEKQMVRTNRAMFPRFERSDCENGVAFEEAVIRLLDSKHYRDVSGPFRCLYPVISPFDRQVNELTQRSVRGASPLLGDDSAVEVTPAEALGFAVPCDVPSLEKDRISYLDDLRKPGLEQSKAK